MSEIKTRISRSEKEIISQNKVVKNYSLQLKSAVVSTERKKAILKEMQSELTAVQYQRPQKRVPVTSVNSHLQSSTNLQNEVRRSPLVSAVTTTAEMELRTRVDNSYLKTRRSTDFIKTARITYSGDAKAVMEMSQSISSATKSDLRKMRLKMIMQNMQTKQMSLKRLKYTTAKTDTDNSIVLKSADVIHSSASTVSQAGGMIRTAVKGTSKGVENIKSVVKNGVKISTKMSVSGIATAVGGGIKNIAKDTGNQVLKTKIDKSKITDTGTEAIKQGITDVRYVDNARKAVVNTARATTKAGVAVKNMPKNTKVQVRRAKAAAKRASEIAKKTAEVVKKVLTSKTGLIILGVIALIIILVFLISGVVSVISSAIGSMFAWMAPDGDTSTEKLQSNISEYITQIQSCETDIQAEIDAIVNGLSPEYRHDGTQIDGLNQFKNSDLQMVDYEAVLAVLATQKYQKVLDGGTEDFSFTDDEIKNAVEMFYNFSYRYEYDFCPDWNCSIDEDCLLSLSAGSFSITRTWFNSAYDYYEVTMQGPTYEHAESLFSTLEIYMTNGGLISGTGYANLDNGTWEMTYNIGRDAYNQIDWSNFYLTVTTVYCNNSDHCYLYGEVVNYDLETVMRKCNFNDEQKELYEIYYSQIQAITGG